MHGAVGGQEHIKGEETVERLGGRSTGVHEEMADSVQSAVKLLLIGVKWAWCYWWDKERSS